MWLPVVLFVGALQIIQGRLRFSSGGNIVAHPNPCIAKILSCDFFRQTFSLYKEKDIGMFTNMKDLKKACKKQEAYIRCMARAEKFCDKMIYSPVYEELIKWRRFPADICQSYSTWQQLYMVEAKCLNVQSKRAFVNCIDKIVGLGNLRHDDTFELGCKYGNAIIDCSASAIVKKCGIFGGHILKKFLKFHSLSDYKCVDIEVDVENSNHNYKPSYDILEGILTVIESHIPVDKVAKDADSERTTNYEETVIELDYIKKPISEDSVAKEAIPVLDPDRPVEEPLTSTGDSSIDINEGYEDLTMEPDKFDFPALPKKHYIHQNTTTFALYEDLEMGHTKYLGCGEADFFWVILSPLRNTYCNLMDLNSEYSESVFKCTLRIDAPCSPELDNEDKNKDAKVNHYRYVLTILTPPNNQKLSDMAIMNVHYLKFYPFSSMNIPEKKVNLWKDQANKATTKKAKPVNRKGHLEFEDDQNNIAYQHGKGSGQKKAMKVTHHLDEYENYDEFENWDNYPQEEEDDDIYFPEIISNEVIYIEDDNGDIISLRDHRSPIHSNSLYKPHSLFRPRIGEMATSASLRDFYKYEKNGRKIAQRSASKERISKSKYLTSKVDSDEQEYCLKEEGCPPNSKASSKSGEKPGKHLDIQNIKSFVSLDEFNQKIHREIPSSTKLHDIGVKSYLGPREVLVVIASTPINQPKSKQSTQAEEFEERDKHSRDVFKRKGNDNVIYITDDSGYLHRYSSVEKNAADSAVVYPKTLKEYQGYQFTRVPYKHFSDSSNAKTNLKNTINWKDLEEKTSSENKSLSKIDLFKIIGSISEILKERSRKITEMALKRRSLNYALANILLNLDRTF